MKAVKLCCGTLPFFHKRKQAMAHDVITCDILLMMFVYFLEFKYWRVVTMVFCMVRLTIRVPPPAFVEVFF